MATLTLHSSTQDVCAWLDTLQADFSPYHQQVLDNHVDGTFVFSTPEGDLIQALGIKKIGHKVLIKKALKNLPTPDKAMSCTTTSAATQQNNEDPHPASDNTKPDVSNDDVFDTPMDITEPDEVRSSSGTSNDSGVVVMPMMSKSAEALEELIQSPARGIWDVEGPTDTKSWTLVQQGYLWKQGMGPLRGGGFKLYWFVLRQQPVTMEARLEQYEGKRFKRFFPINNSIVHPLKVGEFSYAPKKGKKAIVFKCEEATQPGETQKWVFGLQHAANSEVTRTVEVVTKAPPESMATTEPQAYRPIQIVKSAAEAVGGVERSDSNASSVGSQGHKGHIMNTSYMTDLQSKYNFINSDNSVAF